MSEWVSKSVSQSASQSVSQSTNYTYIERGHMLRDNALKFYRDQAYDILQKPIENGQYINTSGAVGRSTHRNADLK